MPDLIDRAQELEDLQREKAIEAFAVKTMETPRIDGGMRVCLVCEEAIDAKRLAANPRAVRCVECQERHEKKLAT